MPNNWKKYKLIEVSTFQRGFDLPIQSRTNGNYPIIASTGIVGWHNQFKVKGLGVSTGRSGSLGEIVYTVGDHWPLNTTLFVKDFHGNYPKFIYYFLKTLDFASFNSGTSVPTLNRNDIHELEVSIPRLPEQKAIAEILSALDDKIELNLQTNKTLEDMANALYKHWFVDFGPFKDGKFVESERGMIPEGWETKRLDEFLTVKRGGSPRPIQDYLRPSGLPWVKISDATSCQTPFLLSTQEFIKKEGLNKTVLLKEGSLILSNSASPGIPKFLNIDACIHDGWLHFPEITRLNKYILFLLFLRIKEHLISQGNGSVFTNLKTDILKSQVVAMPPVHIEESFTDQITPWFHLIRQNAVENDSLKQTRDYLLPKLISGEIRVKEAVKKIKELI